MDQVGILILDEEPASQTALCHMLDSEGWKVRMVPNSGRALEELASGEWRLVIASVRLTGLAGPLFETLRELALAPAIGDEGARVRVLFLVPGAAGFQAQPALERDQLPYVLKPYHLHDLLEKVSDLLLETQAIAEPLRQVRREPPAPRPRVREKAKGRQTTMFASRDDYMMTEEEIAEYERQEQEEQRKKKIRKKPGEGSFDLPQ